MDAKKQKSPATHFDCLNKSKRLNLAVYPELYNACKKICAMRRMSLNELINQLMWTYADDNYNEVRKYDKAFEEE